MPRDTMLPPPRPGDRRVAIIAVGVVLADDDLRDRVERFFHVPMIVLALATLPLLVIEFMQRATGWLQWAVHIGFAVIWLAFLIEFVIKVTIAESRIEYVRRNWLDVVIIVVPMFRPLRATKGVLRTTRVFKMRGVGMKMLKYVVTIIVGLEATERVLERIGINLRRERKEPLEMTRYELMDEVRRLRRLSDAWETWYDEHERFVEEHGGPCRIESPPHQRAETEADPPVPPAAPGADRAGE